MDFAAVLGSHEDGSCTFLLNFSWPFKDPVVDEVPSTNEERLAEIRKPSSNFTPALREMPQELPDDTHTREGGPPRGLDAAGVEQFWGASNAGWRCGPQQYAPFQLYRFKLTLTVLP